ncbi:TIM-barrel domain-containing protein [Bacteroides sp.]|uniref:TIM-barrel domain-containing protein n=1 Tax=Bacteroides sp. TaxID=29523 RepID=UPI00262FAEF4|nr:TIM-barrel domain-containing protein [Bacteroides sp.]
MSNLLSNFRRWKAMPIALFLLAASPYATQAATSKQSSAVAAKQGLRIIGVMKINPTTVEVLFSNHQRMTLDFYGENIFRMFQDNNGGILRDPEAKPEAKILVSQPRKSVSQVDVKDDAGTVSITTGKIKVQFDKNTALMKIINLEIGATAVEQAEPTLFEKERVTLKLKENPQEYFYGGGVQNGRFSHKGKTIAIENQNSWTDGGVASPNPYYWSTNGYGIMWHTFKRGTYDFGREEKNIVKLFHQTDYLDAFVMVNDGAVPLLNDFYQLTGNPVLIPKFGFYQGHLNAYNRDFWKEDENGILFEDGKRYKESQKDNGGIKESLNGEKNNYQFSARAVIDRYKNHDMPFGWLLPNDGYGAGYGQTETIDGNIQNLKDLTDYARKNGVEIGLWTQSDLHPKAGISALLQRDIVKEVRDAGVRVLKTDVAWVGAGYSFGLNGITDVAHIMSYYGSDARPFIISLDGWAGTQRYAGIWSGDQTGGTWEYIRFHIPTYIGSGLSGNPNICSDMDGIFGGKDLAINTRDFQWKTFTPMQLNMDGWGSNEKYPHALGEPATSINRWYLKMKSEIMPYAYSIAKESVDGLPMIRAMFLEYPNPYTLGKATQYQFLYGPYFLVAPIYQATKADEQGNDIRNGIYLPAGEWVDYFSGEIYQGDRIINNYASPLWKLPVFVKNGAIIPMTPPNNNVNETAKNLRIYELYPYGQSTFTEYDDDGTTEEYRAGKGVSTLIESSVGAKGEVTVTIYPTQGDFTGFVKEKATEFRINVTEKPKKIAATIGKNKLKLTEATTMDEFLQKENVYFYDAQPNLNKFATKGSEFEKVVITKNPQLLVKLAATDVTADETSLKIDGFVFAPNDTYKVSTGTLTAPKAQITDTNTASYTLKPTWDKVTNADYYEIEFNGMNYSTIKDAELIFDGLNVETTYDFKIRAVNKDGYSDWSAFSATTKKDPLEFAIHGLSGETSCENQGRSLRKLFDFEEGELWHTKYNVKAVPFDLVVDLHSINQIDKFHYLPRGEAGNGTILKGTVSYSMDKENWTEAGAFEWKRDNETKVFSFPQTPTARYIKMSVTEAVGNYGSGTELYVFKVPGTESYLPGDINNDKFIDENDLTSYTNYTGLRSGDADFEGYVSNGDLNRNGLIDAYDISVVATQLDGGADGIRGEKVAGSISISTPKRTYIKDEVVEVLVKGKGLHQVNALSFALPYNPADYEFVGVQPMGMKEMENLTNDRLHTNGVKALYPTFVNIGEKESLEGDSDLFVLKLKARKNVTFNLKPIDGFLVDKLLNVEKF